MSDVQLASVVVECDRGSTNALSLPNQKHPFRVDVAAAAAAAGGGGGGAVSAPEKCLLCLLE